MPQSIKGDEIILEAYILDAVDVVEVGCDILSGKRCLCKKKNYECDT